MHYEQLMQRAAQAATRHAPSATDALPRRQFLKMGAAGGFALGVLPFAPAAEAADGTTAPDTPKALGPHQQPTAFIRVTPQGEVIVQSNRLDFGQGISTTLAMLAADELDADWSKVRAELAPAADAYKDTGFGIQMTGGSTSTNHSWQQYRELGARTRAMFVAAAAARFGVPAAEVKIVKGVAMAGAKRATLGELSADAAAQAVPATVTLKTAAQFTIIGKPAKSLQGKAKSSGQQQFGLDVNLPGMKTALIARPPTFGAKVAGFDAARAKSVKGVAAVLEVPLDRGARGVAVIADGFWAAKQGREALQPTWNYEGVAKVDSERQLAEYRALATKPGATALAGDTAGLAGAPRKLQVEYVFPYLAHAPMEPLNCTIDIRDDAVEVWVGSQFQTIDQATIAGVLGVPPAKLTFHTMMAGGGFGRRAVPTADYLFEAAQVAKAWRASGGKGPVKIVWSREDDLAGGYYRPLHLHSAEIGFDDKGKVLGWRHRVVGQSIAAGTPFEGFMVKNGVDHLSVEGIVDTPYALPLAVDVHHPVQNVPVLWWRSVGNTHTAFVMETLLDEIARTTGQDPVAYRMALLKPEHQRHRQALQLAVDRSGYGKKKLPAGQAWGVALHESFGSVVAYVVTASLKDGNPQLHTVTAGVHCNQVVNPLNLEAQVQGAALMALGTTLPGAEITLKDGVVQQKNFGEYTVARMPQMPKVTVHTVPSTDAPTGMGEPGLPPLAPAYANALATLTGKTQRGLPFKFA